MPHTNVYYTPYVDNAGHDMSSLVSITIEYNSVVVGVAVLVTGGGTKRLCVNS